jgi:hypothetical protein
LVALVIVQPDLGAAAGEPAGPDSPQTFDGFFAASEDVVRWVVEATGAPYAGACTATRSPEHIGMICSRRMADRSPLRAYLIGRTFSEFTTWVFVQHTATGWQLAGITALDFFSTEERIPWPE